MNYDNDELVTAHIAKAKNSIFTSLPAKIISFDADSCTCSAQPMISIDSEYTEMIMPRIDGVPVYFPSGGGASLTFPVKKNDTCILVFSMLPLEDWIHSDGKKMSFTNGGRSHDITDACALVGFGTKTNNAKADPDNVVLKYGSTKLIVKNDGNAVLEGHLHVTDGISTDKSVEAKVDVKANNKVIAQKNVESVSGDVKAGNKSVLEHTHPYYWTDGAGNDSTGKANR